MGFLTPKVPKPVPPPNPAAPAKGIKTPLPDDLSGFGRASLISTTAQGLRRKPNTERSSLIGG